MSNDQYCPHCKADLQGENIYEYFLKYYSNEEPDVAELKAKEASDQYGGGYFYRDIAIYDSDLDRTVGYKCPDCGKTWERDFKKDRV